MYRTKLILQEHTSKLCLIVALALVAPFYAVLTWQVNYTYLAVRHYALPIIMVEVCIIMLAGLNGFRFVPALNRLPWVSRVALAVWAVIVILAAVIAFQPSNAVVRAEITLLQAAFALALWHEFLGRWKTEKRAVMLALAWGAAFYTALVTAMALMLLDRSDFQWINFGPGVSNVRQLGFYGIALAGISIGLLASEQEPRNRWVQAGLLFTGYYLVDWSGGRAAFGAAIISSLLVVVLTPKVARRRTAMVAFAAFLVAMPASLLLLPSSNYGIQAILGKANLAIAADDMPTYLNGRLELWTETLQRIAERPLIGHGEDQFRDLVITAAGLYNHPHNFVLQLLFQWGFLGAGALGVAAIVFIRHLASVTLADPGVTLPAVGALIGNVLMAMLEGNFYHVYPLMITVTCIAVIASVRFRPIAPDEVVA